MENPLESIVNGLGRVYYTRLRTELLKIVKKHNLEIISGRDLAYARMVQGTKSYISNRGSYIKQGFLYMPQKGAFLTKNSLAMENSEALRASQQDLKRFNLPVDQIEKALAESYRFKDPHTLEEWKLSIPTNRFGENEITTFIFEDLAKEYGTFLKEECGINEMPIYREIGYWSGHHKPYARPAWLNRVGGWGKSELNGRYRGFHGAVRILSRLKSDTIIRDV